MDPDIFETTDRGLTRLANEDAVLSMRLGPGRFLFAVADGLGGRKAGAIASRLAIDTLRAFVTSRLDHSSAAAEVLHDAVMACQAAIFEHVAAHGEHEGMGTTLTAALVSWPDVHVVHVGDSRCYRLSGRSFECLTMDHSMAELVRQMGLRQGENLAAEEHVLWNVVGGRSSDLMPQVLHCPLLPGDTLLLCTDGLTREVSQVEIIQALQSRAGSQAICENLLQNALAGGGRDNITLLVSRFERPVRPERKRQRKRDRVDCRQQDTPSMSSRSGRPNAVHSS